MAPRHGLLMLHGSSLLFGGTALFSRTIGWPALDITAWRSLVACVALAALLSLLGQSLRMRSRRDLIIMLLLGVVLGLHWVTYFAAMQQAGITIGVLTLFTYPVLTVILEPALDRQRPAWADLGMGLVVIAGVALLAPSTDHHDPAVIGIGLGLLSALLFALRNVLQRRHLAHYSGATAITWQTGVIALMLLPWVQQVPGPAQPYASGLLVLLALGFTALPHVMVAESLRQLSAATVGLVSCLQPLYAAVLAALVLDERPGWRTLIGGILVVSAAAIETIRARQRSQRQPPSPAASA